MQKPHALIFDFDGLIVDTEIPVFEGWQADYADFGQELKLEDYVGCVGSDFNGFDPQKHLESLTGEVIDWPTRDEQREAKIREVVNEMGPMEGVVELLDSANEAGIPCAVASSSPRSWVEGHLTRIGLLDRFALTRTLDDVAAPKPSPELFLTAAAELEVDPENAVVFEDSLNGLKASISAGIPCVIVPNPITALLDFEGATRRVESLAELTISQLQEILATTEK